MSAATHSPGPWEVRTSAETVDFGIIVRDPRAEEGWAVIAEVFSEVRYAGERAPEALANAHLIVAAPDMFQTLTDMDGWLENAGYAADHPWRISLRAAIAKASGSTS